MRIDFVRSGGVAGMRLATKLDTQTLPAEEAAQIDRLVEAAGFFELPGELRSESGGADRYQYEITIEGSGKPHSVSVGEAAVPAKLQPLIDYLTRAAQLARGR